MTVHFSGLIHRLQETLAG